MFGFDTNAAIEGMIYFNMESERYLEELIKTVLPTIFANYKTYSKAIRTLEREYDIDEKLSIPDRNTLYDRVCAYYSSK